VTPSRLAYIDESLSHKLAGRLRERGRNARSWKELGFKGRKDPQLVPDVIKRLGEGVVIVTADIHMPEEHADTIKETGATVAVIAPYDGRRTTWASYSDVAAEEAWKREIVHRWAHAIQDQEPHTVRTYSLGGSAPWTPPRKRLHGPQ
jgi:hypothetical protein